MPLVVAVNGWSTSYSSGFTRTMTMSGKQSASEPGHQGPDLVTSGSSSSLVNAGCFRGEPLSPGQHGLLRRNAILSRGRRLQMGRLPGTAHSLPHRLITTQVSVPVGVRGGNAELRSWLEAGADGSLARIVAGLR